MLIQLENRSVRYVIGADGRNLHFIDRNTGIDYAVREPVSHCACLTRDGERCEASAASYAQGRLTLCFDRARASAVLRVTLGEQHLLFEVEEVSGTGVEELVFLNVPLTCRAAADQPFGAGALALNLRTNVEELPGPQRHLWAACYPRFGLLGAKVGVVAGPYTAMRAAMKEVVGGAVELPHAPLGGPWAMDREEAYGSYLFANPTEDTVDAWIALCHNLGFAEIDFCDCLNYGDYQPFPKMYPRGFASLKAVVRRLHDAGIKAGLHAMSFSIAKNCAWVTPVPDPRLGKESTFTLAAPLDPGDTTVYLVEPTGTLPRFTNYLVRRSMTLQVDDELIEFTGVDDARPYGVTGCRRGACGTRIAAHAEGARAHHLLECWGMFAPDGDSTLYAEVAARIAEVIDECGMDMVYLDGLDRGPRHRRRGGPLALRLQVRLCGVPAPAAPGHDGDGRVPPPPLVRPLAPGRLGPSDGPTGAASTPSTARIWTSATRRGSRSGSMTSR